jgi:hypothetical protein
MALRTAELMCIDQRLDGRRSLLPELTDDYPDVVGVVDPRPNRLPAAGTAALRRGATGRGWLGSR